MTDEQEGFLKACSQCRDSARENGRKFYVTGCAATFSVTSDFDKSWLFLAYPGGRMEFSLQGKAIVTDLLKELP